MVRPVEVEHARHSGKPTTSVKQPSKKAGGGGKWSVGRAGDEELLGGFSRSDPNFDPDERRIDPEDGESYKFEQLADYYKGKYTRDVVVEYWSLECKPVLRKKKETAKQVASGPTVADSAGIVVRAKAAANAKGYQAKRAQRLLEEDMAVDGRLAKEIAAVIPHFPYKNMDKYYDFQGLLEKPRLFNALCSMIAKRYRKAGATKIAAFEARGFLLAPVCIKLGLPFILLHKDVELPESVATKDLSVRKDCLVRDDKVILLDDVMFTGKTLQSGIELIKKCGASVLECSVVVEVKALAGREKCLKAGAKEVFGFITDDLLNAIDEEKNAIDEEKNTKEEE